MQTDRVASSRHPNRAAVSSVLALALAIGAIAVAVALPRLPGPTGPPGPPGAGTLVVSYETFVDIDLNGCTNVAQVSVTVPSRGTIVVTSMVRLIIDHFQGFRDMWTVRHALSPTVCETSPDSPNYIDSIDANDASDNSYPASGVVETVYPVVSGTYTFYLNVEKLLGIGAGYTDRFDAASMVAVFYPG